MEVRHEEDGMSKRDVCERLEKLNESIALDDRGQVEVKVEKKKKKDEGRRLNLKVLVHVWDKAEGRTALGTRVRALAAEEEQASVTAYLSRS